MAWMAKARAAKVYAVINLSHEFLDGTRVLVAGTPINSREGRTRPGKHGRQLHCQQDSRLPHEVLDLAWRASLFPDVGLSEAPLKRGATVYPGDLDRPEALGTAR